MHIKFITLALITAIVNLFGVFSLSMQNVGKRTRGRYHRSGRRSSRLHIDEPALREWALFSFRNGGRGQI